MLLAGRFVWRVVVVYGSLGVSCRLLSLWFTRCALCVVCCALFSGRCLLFDVGR